MRKTYLLRTIIENKDYFDIFITSRFIAIGWPGIGNLLGKSREDIKIILQGKPYKLSGLKLGNTYPVIDIFLNEMEIGDIVLVPHGDDIYFAEIKSGYKYNIIYNYCPHQRDVQWLSKTSRDKLSASLRSALKIHRVTANLSKHAVEINALSIGIPYILIKGDGSVSEKAFKILSQHNDKGYEKALIYSQHLIDYFREIIGDDDIAECCRNNIDTLFQAAAFYIAHTHGKIQD